MSKKIIDSHQISLGPVQHLDFIATSVVTKWGNSQGIRLPKAVIDVLGLNINDELELRIMDGGIFIKKSLHKKKYKNLRERMEDYYQCNFEEIEIIETEEVNWGTPTGDEYW